MQREIMISKAGRVDAENALGCPMVVGLSDEEKAAVRDGKTVVLTGQEWSEPFHTGTTFRAVTWSGGDHYAPSVPSEELVRKL